MAVFIARFDKPCDQPSDINGLLELLNRLGLEIFNYGVLVYVAYKQLKGCSIVDEVVWSRMRIKRHYVGRDNEDRIVVSYVVEPICQCDYMDCPEE